MTNTYTTTPSDGKPIDVTHEDPSQIETTLDVAGAGSVIALSTPRAGCDANGWWVRTPRNLLWPHPDRTSAARHVRWLQSQFLVVQS